MATSTPDDPDPWGRYLKYERMVEHYRMHPDKRRFIRRHQQLLEQPSRAPSGAFVVWSVIGGLLLVVFALFCYWLV